MIWLYRLIFWPFFILLLPTYLIRLWRRGGNWHMAERFGNIQPPPKRPGVQRLWIHAVSVGELNALKTLLLALGKIPNTEIVLSTTTTTGYRVAEDKYKGMVNYLFTFPLDPFCGRAWKKLKPDKLLLMEGELWPNILHLANKSRVPVYLINARLSDKSFRRMKVIPWAAKWLLSKVSRVLTSTRQDTERYLSLGVNPELLSQTGSLKFDAVQSRSLDEAKRAELLRSLGWTSAERIIVGSSTWAGEEEALLNAYQGLKEKFVNLRLLLVPRHAERGAEVEALLQKSGVSYHRRSKGVVQGTPEVVLADTTGELSSLVQLSTIIFVGKSLAPHTEGQTPIEPAAAGKPVIMGYGMSNFRLIAQSLVDSGGGQFVGGAAELKEVLGALLDSPQTCNQMGEKALGWFEENRGATARTISWLGLEEKEPV